MLEFYHLDLKEHIEINKKRDRYYSISLNFIKNIIVPLNQDGYVIPTGIVKCTWTILPNNSSGSIQYECTSGEGIGNFISFYIATGAIPGEKIDIRSGVQVGDYTYSGRPSSIKSVTKSFTVRKGYTTDISATIGPA